MSQRTPKLGIRWTIGDVSEFGFHALQLSIRSACSLFGERAAYAVCVNKIPAEFVAEHTGPMSCEVRWIQSEDYSLDWLKPHVDAAMAEGVAWKLAPVRVFEAIHELSLDNDVLLWRIPPALEEWLQMDDACLLAADVQPAFGQFSNMCGKHALNSGIRGLPPWLNYEACLRKTLETSGIVMRSELDEQGLQAAVCLSAPDLKIVPLSDVSVCSPFPMHQRMLGRCGAHFVGLNPKHAPWLIDGVEAHIAIRRLWASYLPEIERRIRAAEQTAVSPTEALLEPFATAS